jgi:hypothetical protein
LYQHFSFQGPPKFTQIGIFWFENTPSGNPEDAEKRSFPSKISGLHQITKVPTSIATDRDPKLKRVEQNDYIQK